MIHNAYGMKARELNYTGKFNAFTYPKLTRPLFGTQLQKIIL